MCMVMVSRVAKDISSSPMLRYESLLTQREVDFETKRGHMEGVLHPSSHPHPSWTHETDEKRWIEDEAPPQPKEEVERSYGEVGSGIKRKKPQ